MDKNNNKTTVSYPKFLVELKIGRKLHPDNETVDHIDTDFNNNKISNLRILKRNVHAKEDILKTRKSKQKLKCKWCKINFKGYAGNRQYSKAGPFCSRRCTGKYGAAIQNKKVNNFTNSTVQEFDYRYKRNIKSNIKAL